MAGPVAGPRGGGVTEGVGSYESGWGDGAWRLCGWVNVRADGCAAVACGLGTWVSWGPVGAGMGVGTW